MESIGVSNELEKHHRARFMTEQVEICDVLGQSKEAPKIEVECFDQSIVTSSKADFKFSNEKEGLLCAINSKRTAPDLVRQSRCQSDVGLVKGLQMSPICPDNGFGDKLSTGKSSDRWLKNGPHDEEFFRCLESLILEAISVVKNEKTDVYRTLLGTEGFNDRLRRS